MFVKLIPNQEMRQLLSELVQGRTIIHIECEASKADIAKMNTKKSLNLGDNSTPIYCVTSAEPYNSIKEAAIDLGLDPGAISRVINGKQKSTKGYRFYSIKETK